MATFRGIIAIDVDADDRDQAVERLGRWAERCVQRCEGEGMNTKQYIVWVDGLGQHRNGERWIGLLPDQDEP